MGSQYEIQGPLESMPFCPSSARMSSLAGLGPDCPGAYPPAQVSTAAGYAGADS